MSGFPETSGFAMVLKRAGQALVLSGESARQAGSILENMEEHSLACRVSDLIRVLDVFAHAPADESYTVVASGYDPAVCSGAESVVNDAIEYISSHLSGEISMDLAARQAGMSVSAFSSVQKGCRNRVFRFCSTIAYRACMQIADDHESKRRFDSSRLRIW